MSSKSAVQPKAHVKWPSMKLRELTSKIGSGATPRGGNRSYKETGVTLIRSQNVFDDGFVYDGLAYLDDHQASELDNVGVCEDDVLLNITGAAVARCCMVPKRILPARVNQHVLIVRPKQDILNAAFLWYTLISPNEKSRLLSISHGGATREALTKEAIENYEISVPSLETQARISSILLAYDNLIENNRRRIQLLEEMARALYREWFVHFRFPGHEGVQMVESELGEIPKNWEVKRLKDVMELKYGRGLRKANRIRGDFPVYGSSGIIGYHREKLVDGPGIIVGRKGNPGRVTWSQIGFYPIDTTYYVSTGMSMYYVFYQLGEMEFIDTHTAVPGLSRDSAYTKDFLVPAQELVERFEKIVKPIFALDYILKLLNEKLHEVRDMLLPKLVSGKLDVSDLEIEIPPDAHKTSKYSDRSTLDQWLERDNGTS